MLRAIRREEGHGKEGKSVSPEGLNSKNPEGIHVSKIRKGREEGILE